MEIDNKMKYYLIGEMVLAFCNTGNCLTIKEKIAKSNLMN